MDILDELLTEASSPPPVVDKPAIQKLNYSHNAMIDMIIANPGISQNHLAARFGYTASWICQVMASDAFQAAMAKRADEVIDPVLKNTVRENFEAIIMRSQEILMDKLSKSSDVVPDQLVIQALNVASKAQGYGAKPEAPPVQVSEVHLHLEQMGEQLTTLLRRKKHEIIDHKTEEIAELTSES